MKAFWAKITAWFMAIIAFFTGLFSAGNQPPEEPKPEQTSEVIAMPTEPTSEPASEPNVPAVLPLSVHIQDSVGGDDHLIPGDGNIDWDAFTRTLHTVGYTGDCVLEAHHQSLYAADEERDAILARLLEKGKELQQAMAYTA